MTTTGNLTGIITGSDSDNINPLKDSNKGKFLDDNYEEEEEKVEINNKINSKIDDDNENTLIPSKKTGLFSNLKPAKMKKR